ncbi:MAG: UDP-N-acetylmuramate dehydrogenase [Spirochaetota bacterium]|nr:UDP-N-acetylmuramate dehydrogenase [Spirochaetota bacterium]
MKRSIDREIVERLERLGSVRIDEPMRNHTSFRTGGTADIFIYPNNHDSMRGIALLAREKLIPLTVIGGGSNLLVSDKGIRGIVARLSEDGVINGRIEIQRDGLVYADSVKKKEDFINFCIDHNFEGMEFMAGIPGCIGGGIIMNAGTILGNFADILKNVAYIDNAGEMRIEEVSKETAGYRTLGFEDAVIILGGFFKLSAAENIDDVKERIRDIIDDRKEKHPLDYPSAGSVFKNPPGYCSWELVDDAGLKGMRVGGAVVSHLHTNFIINTDNASSSDILNLIDIIKEKVYLKYNIKLETEIKMIGEF